MDAIAQLSDAETKLLTKYYVPLRDKEETFIRTTHGGTLLPVAYTKYQQQIFDFQLRDNDVFVLTFPKAGTSWMSELIWCLVNDFDTNTKIDIVDRVNFLETDIVFDFVKKKEADHYFAAERLDVISKMKSPRIIRSHLPHCLLPADLLHRCKVVTCLRNPKDTLVSYYFNAKLFKATGFCGDFESYFELFMNDLVMFSPFWDHVLESWQLKDSPNMCLVFYEDMKNNLERVIRKIAEFLERSITEDQVSDLMQHLSFRSMKENPAINLESQRGEQIIQESETQFIRKGEVGDWKNYFTDEMNKRMDDAIKSHFNNTGLEFRYE